MLVQHVRDRAAGSDFVLTPSDLVQHLDWGIYRLEMSDNGGDGWQGAQWCVLDTDDYTHDCADMDFDATDAWTDNCAGTAIPGTCGYYDDSGLRSGRHVLLAGGRVRTLCRRCLRSDLAAIAGSANAPKRAERHRRRTARSRTGSFGVEWMCLEDGCFELLVGGGTATTRRSASSSSTRGTATSPDFTAPYADHFCVAGGLVFDHPTASPSVSLAPSSVPTPKPTTHCVDTNDGAISWLATTAASASDGANLRRHHALSPGLLLGRRGLLLGGHVLRLRRRRQPRLRADAVTDVVVSPSISAAPTKEEFWMFATTGDCIASGPCISSPNYPSAYGNSQFLRDHADGERPALEVVAFDVEYNSVCVWDYLDVDGAKFCGSTGPDGVAVTAYETTMSWYADGSVTDAGFQICYLLAPTPAPTMYPTNPTPVPIPVPTPGPTVTFSPTAERLLVCDFETPLGATPAPSRLQSRRLSASMDTDNTPPIRTDG